MKALFYHGNVEFRQLRHTIPNITDGSLASHLKVLEHLQFIKVHKEIVGRKLRTSYEITEYGRNIYKEFENSLKAFVKIGDSCYE
jgi:DNA-binding HxlR family transcriptional regulator